MNDPEDYDPRRAREPPPSPSRNARVGLLVTCLMDALRPSIGRACVRLLEKAHCVVAVPAQSCCGQIAYNNGDKATARRLAISVIDAFETYDYVVAPSGSCAAMLRTHFPRLLAEDPEMLARAEDLSRRTFELTRFLVDVCKVRNLDAVFEGVVTYHDGCSGLREHGVFDQPRRLLAMVKGLTLRETHDEVNCCGFGGVFSVKFPEISCTMAERKLERIRAVGADLVVAGELGCLMHLSGFARRQGETIPFRHVAEVLGEELDAPPLHAPGAMD